MQFCHFRVICLSYRENRDTINRLSKNRSGAITHYFFHQFGTSPVGGSMITEKRNRQGPLLAR